MMEYEDHAEMSNISVVSYGVFLTRGSYASDHKARKISRRTMDGQDDLRAQAPDVPEAHKANSDCIYIQSVKWCCTLS
jgi:hypothetical protein